MPFQPKQHNIDFDALQNHFHMPMAQVAKKFDVCLTFFKKICRQHGIKRWPYRKLKSLEKRITTLTERVEGKSEDNLNQFNTQLDDLKGLKAYDNYFAEEHRPPSDEEGQRPARAAPTSQRASSQRASKRRRAEMEAEMDSSPSPKRVPAPSFDPMAALAQLACASRMVEAESQEEDAEASSDDESAETMPTMYSDEEEKPTLTEEPPSSQRTAKQEDRDDTMVQPGIPFGTASAALPSNMPVLVGLPALGQLAAGETSRVPHVMPIPDLVGYGMPGLVSMRQGVEAAKKPMSVDTLLHHTSSAGLIHW